MGDELSDIFVKPDALPSASQPAAESPHPAPSPQPTGVSGDGLEGLLTKDQLALLHPGSETLPTESNSIRVDASGEIKGITSRKNPKNGFCAVFLHYSANGMKAQPEWISRTKRGMMDDAWKQEYEVDFSQRQGSRIFPEFRYDQHVKKVRFNPDLPLLRGWDFGFRHPAVIFAQINLKDQFCLLHELQGTDIILHRFAKAVMGFTNKHYRALAGSRLEIIDFGDPAGNQVNDKSEMSSIQLLRKFGINVKHRRIGKKEQVLTIRQQLMIRPESDEPGMLIDPNGCPVYVEGMAGGYVEQDPKKGWQEKELPKSDAYFSHTQDAAMYIAVNKFKLRSKPNTWEQEKVEKYNPYNDPLGDEPVDTERVDSQFVVTGYA